MVKEHFFGQGRPLTQRKKFQHLIFLAGQVHGLACHFDSFGIQIDRNLTRADHRLRMPFGPPNDRMNPGDQFVPVEGFGHVIICAETEALDFALCIVLA